MIFSSCPFLLRRHVQPRRKRDLSQSTLNRILNFSLMPILGIQPSHRTTKTLISSLDNNRPKPTVHFLAVRLNPNKMHLMLSPNRNPRQVHKPMHIFVFLTLFDLKRVINRNALASLTSNPTTKRNIPPKPIFFNNNPRTPSERQRRDNKQHPCQYSHLIPHTSRMRWCARRTFQPSSAVARTISFASI